MITSEEFKQDVLAWSQEIGVAPKEIHIRKMKRKWASCSSRGRLTFDPSLFMEPEEVRAHAIVHELLHLKYPNHGRMFNVLLKTYLRKGQRGDIGMSFEQKK
jgi:predicted metal-dependent hydrolase